MKHFIAALFFLGIFACTSSDPEEKAILSVVEEMRVSAESKNFDALVSQIADDYHDNLDQNHEKLSGRLPITFSSYQRLEIKAPVQKLVRNGLLATISLKVRVAGIQDGRKEWVFGSPITSKNVELDLEKREGKWKVVGSRVGQ